MSKFVKGSYETASAAQRAIDELVAEGYSKKDITLVTNKDMSTTVQDEGVEVTTKTDVDHDDESMWEKIKDAFRIDPYDETTGDNDDVLADYTDDIRNGSIVVLVDGIKNDTADSPSMDDTTMPNTPTSGMTEPMGTTDFVDPTDTVSSTGVNPSMDAASDTIGTDDTNQSVPPADWGGATQDMTHDTDMGVAPDNSTVDNTASKDFSDKEKIKLQEEKLDVDTKEVQTGEVHVDKVVTEETQTVEVPVKHEEVRVERRPVTDGETADEADLKDESFTVPVVEEQIEVHKRPVVTEEVVIDKDTKEDVKHVSEEVRKEDIDIHTDGDVQIEDNDRDKL